MTKRIATSVLIACAALAAGAVMPGQGVAAETAAIQEARLISASRDRVTISRDDIRLGDLFSNTGDKSGITIENAPAPGAQSVFDVYRLAAIAQSHGLTWQARSWSEKVVIERAGQVIPEEQLLIVLRKAVDREMSAEGRFDIEMTTRDLTLTLPANVVPAVEVENLRLQRASGMFSANIVAAGTGAPLRLAVAGRIHRVIEVPTLVRRMNSGDIIENGDIQWVTLRAERVGRNVITDINRLTGMTPTRTLVAGRVVMSGEVRAPRVIQKGGLVVMLLKTHNMVLTSKGRALEHGAKGDVIKVQNTQSKTVIEGEVTGPGTVTVSATAFAPLAMPKAADAAPARR